MHIIIPMAGHSRRFNQAGYKGPKYLLPVGETRMINHVVDMFSPDDYFHFIINDLQAKNYPNLVSYLKKIASRSDVTIIPEHEKGPVYSALMVKGIDNDVPIIVSYCDFTVNWDYNAFKRHAYGFDGAVVSFKGFHPASFGNTYYAYMKTENDKFLELREKKVLQMTGQ